MYRGVVYFNGPQTRWSHKIDPAEVIFDFSHPWRWLVESRTRQVWRQLDPSRCGYAVLREDSVLAEFHPVKGA